MNNTEILKLYKRYEVPDNIRKHMLIVSKVAVYLGKKIVKTSAEKVDITGLKSASLIHDIAKILEFKVDIKNQKWLKLIHKYKKIGHANALKFILPQTKYLNIVNIASKHEIQSIIAENPVNRPRTLEEKILYYADKRVEGNKIVTLKTRIDNCAKKYYGNKKIPEKHLKMVLAAKTLEKELCSLAAIKPSDINGISINI